MFNYRVNIKEHIRCPGIRDRLILVVAGLLLYLPFLGSVNLFDWDEINFPEALKQDSLLPAYMNNLIPRF